LSKLVRAEPGNTTYQRDVSISYERLADLAIEAGEEAERLVIRAVGIRRPLLAREPARADLADELGVALYQLASLGSVGTRHEMMEFLDPFERTGTISSTGAELLKWARN
jgi:hypothetical protein